MNHAIPGVNAGYITRHKLLEDHLRSQQQTISNAVFAVLSSLLTESPEIRGWLGPGATRSAIERTKINQNDRRDLVVIVRAIDREAA
jgi:hypothetical protein